LSNASYRRWKNRLLVGAGAVAVLTCLVPLASVLVTMIAKGAGELTPHFLVAPAAPVGENGGIGHAIAGSLCLLLVASVVALPIGIGTGMYLARGGDARLSGVIRLLLDVMTGIPAIIVGVFMYTVVVRKQGFTIGLGFSMVAGGLALAMIMLPIVARTAEEALRAVPRSIDEAGLALGLPRRRVVLRIVLRSAMPSVLTGAFLALARVAGEAAPLLFTAFGSNEWPGSPLRPVGSLPQLLFDYARQPFQELVRQAWGAALVLVILILGVRIMTQVYGRWRYGHGGGGH
jgi:phosphate transport system permease protein